MAEAPLGRRLVWRLEGAGAWLLFQFFRILPLDWASALGGFLARSIGPRLGSSKRARLNLARAMPELAPAEVEQIVCGVWDNLGRVVAEYPHLDQFQVYAPGGRVSVDGDIEPLREKVNAGRRCIFFSAHYGNWEIATLGATQAGLEVAGIYRAANNPFVDKLIHQARRVTGSELLPKGAAAARGAVAALRGGKHLCILVDQKMNDGIAVPFFGRDAMTAPALAMLALHFDCLVVPVHVERLGGAHFRLVVEPVLPLERSGDAKSDQLRLMTRVNAVIERWIRARPDHWFWLHRRWPD